MEWFDVKDQVPEMYDTVLVVTDRYGDGALDFFVADAWPHDRMWHINLHFKGKNSPYVSLGFPFLKGDRWTYIDDPDDD